MKEDDTVKVGDVLAKIKAGEAPAQPAEKDSCDPKQEDAGAGAAPVESTAVDKETQGDSGALCQPVSELGMSCSNLTKGGSVSYSLHSCSGVSSRCKAGKALLSHQNRTA